ncbi:MAG: restriction endonuclease subunit S, partial [Bacteroidaceae bacterium]|nr:restriction endonuclease subunit S [Bacteroidaceae bacterium]
MSWENVRLGDVISTLKGFAFKSSLYTEFGHPIVRASNFTIDSISDNDLKYYSYEEALQYEKYSLKKNDVLIQTVGSWEYNPNSVVGKVVRVPRQLDGALLNQNIVKIIPDSTIDNGFLYYRLKCTDFAKYNIGNAVGAANQASITLDTIRDFYFKCPNIITQKRISNVLSAYDDLIENNQKQIKLLEEAAQRLYKEWFVDLRFPGYETTPIIDGIPEGWRVLQFSEVFDFVRGKSYTSKELSEDSGVLMVNLKNINSFGGYKRNAEKRFLGSYKENQTLTDGDVVMGVTDMTQERRLVGYVAMIPSFSEKATFSMDLIKLIPKSVSTNYLYSALRFGG